MNLKPQKRMASEILKCGENRVYFDPYLIEDISLAITREDVRNLIKQGAIQKKYKQGISKYRNARTPKKRAWILRIRPIRRELKKLRDRKLITATNYRKLYKNAKGGMFTSVAQLNRYIKEKELIRRGRGR